MKIIDLNEPESGSESWFWKDRIETRILRWKDWCVTEQVTSSSSHQYHSYQASLAHRQKKLTFLNERVHLGLKPVFEHLLVFSAFFLFLENVSPVLIHVAPLLHHLLLVLVNVTEPSNFFFRAVSFTLNDLVSGDHFYCPTFFFTYNSKVMLCIDLPPAKGNSHISAKISSGIAT